MNINGKIHGFIVTSSERIDELDATLYEMLHEKSGAALAFLDRADENKSFAISFTTIPEDDTGVFHILEHSVLCGSDKYPVKEPFVELLKGSLNTFLNAMTYEDRTVYPVASRNDKDFYNLVSVYTDAVFHPLAVRNECVFRQEGWHFETEGDALSYNGVVYNEMKGAYSSPDEMGDMALSRALFPTTLYRHDSGGDPKAIPELTFEKFRAAHEKYYHPSNAKIFLDGSVKLDEILGLLDSVLSEYDKIETLHKIPAEPATDGGRVTLRYDIPDSDDPEGKARLLLGSVFSDFSDTLTNAAVNLVINALTATNDSPLKKKILDTGLCEDFSMLAQTARQTTVTAEFLNCREDDIGALEELYISEIRKIAAEGIDRELIDAGLSAVEFKLRERDFGTLPKGIAFALSAFGSWNYGERPAHGLTSLDTVDALRKLADGDYYERLLLDFTVDCPHRASVVMLPDKTVAEVEARAERDRLEKIRASLTSDGLAKIKADEARLKEWQSTDDTPENLDTLPRLLISDVTSEPRSLRPKIARVGDTEILSTDIETGGITYLSLFFDASDLTREELFFLSLLSASIVNLPTESHTPLELQKLIGTHLGNMYHTVSVNKKGDRVTPVFVMHASALDSKREKLISLTEETLLHTLYTDGAILKSIITQMRASLEEAVISSGSTVALGRAFAAVSREGAVKEYLSGFEAYKLYKKYSKSFDGDAVSKALAAIAKKIFTRERLTVAYTGAPDAELEKRIAELFPTDGVIPEECKISPLGSMREAIATPSKVAYAVIGASLDGLDARMQGALRVARSILSYEYLWNEIRVKGGAYGTGFVVRKSGNAAFYSYRDPSPENSLEKYRTASEFLRALAASGENLTKFIIGAVGEYDILTTPRLAGEQAVWDHLNGWSVEDDRELRLGMLETDGDKLLKVAAVIDEICDTGATSVVGGKELVDSFSKKFDTVTVL